MLPVAISALLRVSRAFPTGPLHALDARAALHCPLHLPKDDHEYPHLMIPISSSPPNASMGNTYSPTMSPDDIATIFNFDTPVSRANDNCSLFFTFPNQSQLVTSSYSFAGLGTFEFSSYQYGNGASLETTWTTQPMMSGFSDTLFGVAPGTSHLVWSSPCGQGGIFAWRMKSLDSCF